MSLSILRSSGEDFASSGLQPLIVGNWKMNGLSGDAHKIESLLEKTEKVSQHVRVIICPPATLISSFSEILAQSQIKIGAQDCHHCDFGAYTGDISARMLADIGAVSVILGHSERRIGHGESSSLVQKKAIAAHKAGLAPIICIGETEQERDSGQRERVLKTQLLESLPDRGSVEWENISIAYEPVWAIGTGKIPTGAELSDVHGTIRDELKQICKVQGQKVRIIYGGSVTPQSIANLLGIKDVDGVLAGGSSLCPSSFSSIILAYS